MYYAREGARFDSVALWNLVIAGITLNGYYGIPRKIPLTCPSQKKNVMVQQIIRKCNVDEESNECQDDNGGDVDDGATCRLALDVEQTMREQTYSRGYNSDITWTGIQCGGSCSHNQRSPDAYLEFLDADDGADAGARGGKRAWSILQVCLLANASDTLFFKRISSRSGDERSGRKGTKMGPAAVVLMGDERCVCD